MSYSFRTIAERLVKYDQLEDIEFLFRSRDFAVLSSSFQNRGMKHGIPVMKRSVPLSGDH
jgi:hypothetical protein